MRTIIHLSKTLDIRIIQHAEIKCKRKVEENRMDEHLKRSCELWEREKTVKDGKEARALHKEMLEHFGKRSGHGLSFRKRYPWLPFIPSIAMSMAAIIISIMRLLK